MLYYKSCFPRPRRYGSSNHTSVYLLAACVAYRMVAICLISPTNPIETTATGSSLLFGRRSSRKDTYDHFPVVV